MTVNTRKPQEMQADPILVTILHEGRERVFGPFTKSFRIGREDECEVTVPAQAVSRVHAAVQQEHGAWRLEDRGSSNGTFVNGERITERTISPDDSVRLAKDGPVVRFSHPREKSSSADTVRRPARTAIGVSNEPSIDDIAAHYLSADSDREAGEHTIMIRRAFQTVSEQKEKHHRKRIITVVAMAAFVILVSFVLLIQSERRRKAAEREIATIFDEVRKMELSLAEDARDLAEQGESSSEILSDERARLNSINERYEAFITEYGFRRKLSEEEKLIHQTALVFNESELELPAGFARDVKRTIDEYWLTSAGKGRFIRGLRKAEENGYIDTIVRELDQYGLPPDFIYLALIESDFEPREVSGIKPARFDWAKGMWQFIPPTAERYDLEVGPLREEQRFDPEDERHDFEKSTAAAARYLSEIYTTLAQASGLLVFASYNWGEFGVARRLEALPDPPGLREMDRDTESRSYWRFYGEYEDAMPEETKNYVLRVFSAAVVGRDPRFFDIDMDDPLARYR